MDEEIKHKLSEFNEYRAKTSELNFASFVKPGEPVKFATEYDLLLYGKWRTKADIALNEVHTLQAKKYPQSSPWSLRQLEEERRELIKKLKQNEEWLKERSKP
jgi:hypothetical protein